MSRKTGLLLIICACAAPSGADIEATTTSSVLSDRTFFIQGPGSAGRRCFDVGAEGTRAEHAPVRLATCNRGASQWIRVREIDAASHDVILTVPRTTLCLGIGAAPGGPSGVVPGAPLELQICSAGRAAQRFAFDGDTLLVGAQPDGQRVSRELAIEPRGDATTVGTPLVVGTRETSDAEFFQMVATDGSSARPTSGFIAATDGPQLNASLLLLGWGSVIEVTDSFTMVPEVHHVRAGVTVRGARRLLDNGPEIHYDRVASRNGTGRAFSVEDHTRITGLRLRGFSREDDGDLEKIAGIYVDEALFGPVTDVRVDHLDISDWTDAAVKVHGRFTQDVVDPTTCGFPGPYPRTPVVRVARNFIHHNIGGFGYGVVVGNGQFPLVAGNVMYMQRHSVTSSAEGTSGFVAEDNFLLSDSRNGPYTSNTDFDSHGWSPEGGHWTCPDDPTAPFCVAGDVFDMGWNTFLSHDHRNFGQRGTPCHYSFFHNNVSVQSAGAVHTVSQPPTTLILASNQWLAANPTSNLGVGDFDGDGVDDVFVGTGVTWWFSSGGRSEWRLLNRMPERASELRFGDFDGDGRTDVLAVHPTSRIDVSWAGISPWNLVAASGARTVSELAIGDFDGDGRADVFHANGTAFVFASGAQTWTHLAFSQLRTDQLRFGDFTADGKTDVFYVVNGLGRLIRGGGNGIAEPWGPGMASVAGIVVGDFDGDMAADLAKTVSLDWVWSRSGLAGFVPLRSAGGLSLPTLPVGRFDGDAKTDVIFFSGLDFWIAPAGKNPVRQISRQHMR
jgi:hypothetical protein